MDTVCGEGIYPRWAAQQPQNLTPRFVRSLAFNHFGGASHPNGDKSPHHKKAALPLSQSSINALSAKAASANSNSLNTRTP